MGGRLADPGQETVRPIQGLGTARRAGRALPATVGPTRHEHGGTRLGAGAAIPLDEPR